MGAFNAWERPTLKEMAADSELKSFVGSLDSHELCTHEKVVAKATPTTDGSQTLYEERCVKCGAFRRKIIE